MTILDYLIIEHLILHPATEAELKERTQAEVSRNLEQLQQGGYIRKSGDVYHYTADIPTRPICIVLGDDKAVYVNILRELGFDAVSVTKSHITDQLKQADAILVKGPSDKFKGWIDRAERMGVKIIYV
jgi:hypothetical protein